QRSDRLAAIGQVAGGIAHELRNPLNVVQTSAYYLLNARNPSPEKTAEHLRRIEKQVGVANGVITTLSNFAKMPVPNLIPFSADRGSVTSRENQHAFHWASPPLAGHQRKATSRDRCRYAAKIGGESLDQVVS